MPTRTATSYSAFRAVSAMVRRLKSNLEEKERMPDRAELVRMIESGKHVLIGAKALAYYLKPRFTEDTDYVVSGQTFAKVRKWAREKKISHEDLGLVLRFEAMGIDIIDARSNAILKAILQQGAKPSIEALAAAKYVAFINPFRKERRLQDVADFAQLVTSPGFSLEKLRSYFVDVYQQQWPEAEKLIDDIRNGRPITI